MGWWSGRVCAGHAYIYIRNVNIPAECQALCPLLCPHCTAMPAAAETETAPMSVPDVKLMVEWAVRFEVSKSVYHAYDGVPSGCTVLFCAVNTGHSCFSEVMCGPDTNG